MTSEDDIFTALRGFLLAVLPAGTEVLQTQQNRVPQPRGPNYVMMTASGRSFQSSSYRLYRSADDQVDIARSTAAGFQLDFYGPLSSDYAQRFATLFRDDYGFVWFAANAPAVGPLYCDDGSQMPLTNGEKQYEARWMIQAMLQVNPIVSTPMQFADRVDVTIVKAD